MPDVPEEVQKEFEASLEDEAQQWIKAMIAEYGPRPPASFDFAPSSPYRRYADFTKPRVQRVISALKARFRENRKARATKKAIKDGLEEGSREVLDRHFKGDVPEVANAIREKFVENQLTYLGKYISGVYKHEYLIAPGRNAMYADALHSLECRLIALKAERNGDRWEKRVLGPGDNRCPECIALARKGWRRIGTLPPIGDTICKTNCKCRFEYSSETRKP